MTDSKKIAIIFGAGPAGLTAAYELLHKTDIIPIIFEQTSDIGGLAKTINYKGNRLDIGGHRFFSKSERIMKWWLNILPIESLDNLNDKEFKFNDNYFPKPKINKELNPDNVEDVMLIKKRLSRIYFLRKFFDYPISLSIDTLKRLGLIRILKIGLSYFKTKLLPKREEKSIEDFFINRFGKELYLCFFKDYTEKVWGIPCNQISAEWGNQRVKGLSLFKALIHGLTKHFKIRKSISQKNTETSLIEYFIYPKYGPGQLWEKVAKIIISKGGQIFLNQKLTTIKLKDLSITSITVTDQKTSQTQSYKGDYFFSSVPVKELISAMNVNGDLPVDVLKIASGLNYRDFITVGLLVRKLKIKSPTSNNSENNLIPDNWIYIQEKEVKLGRLQIVNNWSPYMVSDKNTVWLGLEYFCNEGDEMWNKPDKDFIDFAISELIKIDIIEGEDVLDATIAKIPKTYPVYSGEYPRFKIIREFTDKIENLFLIGRNGMHRYNNQDHSMLSAMIAVENIVNNIKTKDNIWSVNTENDYHEIKK